MQPESNQPANNQGGINQNSNQKQGFDNQQTGTCPIFNSNRQNAPRNPYYATFNNNNPQIDMQTAGNPPMNNPYISAQNPLSQNSGIQSNGLQSNIIPTQALEDNSSATADFIKGALIGAAVTYLLTNEKVQNSLFKTAAKTSSMFQMGMEEVKERYEDAKAETAAAQNMND